MERRQAAHHPRTIRQGARAQRRFGVLEQLRRWIRFRLVVPVFRSRHPPEFTARGVANGVFWGLTPTVGLQTIEIAVTWVVGRKVFGADSSLVQALIWVWVNNPLTMVPMYYVFYLTGLLLTGASGVATGYESFLAIWDRPDASWSELVSHVAATVGVPTLIGSLPYAAVGAVVSYRWALAVVGRRRARLARASL